MADYVEITSLCRVARNMEGHLWLNRLGDIIDGKVCPIRKSKRSTNDFENRERIYRRGGPDEDGFIGVWEWTAIPNLSNPETDYVESTFLPELYPTLVVILNNARSTREVIEQLKSGEIHELKMICNTYFCYAQKADVYAGLFCRADQFSFVDGRVMLHENVCSLPYYEVKAIDMYTSMDHHLRFIRSLDLPDAKMIVLGDINQLLAEIVLKRLTWPKYREVIGKTKADWKDCKSIFERICSESLYEEVSNKIGCTAEEAIDYVNDFSERTNNQIEAGDIDSETLSKIILSNESLKQHCEAIADGHWRKEHQSELADAEQRVQAVRTQIQKEESQLEETSAAYEQTKMDIELARKELNQLQTEIVNHQTLAKEAERSIQERIGRAQANMADFLAEISVFMPSAKQDRSQKWELKPGISGQTERKLESWEDTYDLIRYNLSIAGVTSVLKQNILGAFLFAAYLQKFPIMLAGPGAREIANAVSLAVTGATASILRCYGDREMPQFSDTTGFVAVENPFHPEWISGLPELDSNSNPDCWLHPFSDDLIMEPRGLWNYVFPIFTDIFIENAPSAENMECGKREKEYETFHQNDKNEKIKVNLAFAKENGVSRLLISKVKTVLQNSKIIAGLNKSSTMEHLIVSIPMAVLSGKQDSLQNLTEDNNVKKEIMLYLNDGAGL